MAPLKIALVGVLGIGVAASLAFADHKPNHPGGGDTGGVTGTWVFAGYTAATTLGDAMLPVLYEMCQFEFGPDARMALIEEWIKSPNIMLPTTPARIQPVQNTQQEPFQTSGNNCAGWTQSGTVGFVVRLNGSLDTGSCSADFAVACVVPQ